MLAHLKIQKIAFTVKQIKFKPKTVHARMAGLPCWLKNQSCRFLHNHKKTESKQDARSPINFHFHFPESRRWQKPHSLASSSTSRGRPVFFPWTGCIRAVCTKMGGEKKEENKMMGVEIRIARIIIIGVPQEWNKWSLCESNTGVFFSQPSPTVSTVHCQKHMTGWGKLAQFAQSIDRMGKVSTKREQNVEPLTRSGIRKWSFSWGEHHDLIWRLTVLPR